MKRRNRKKVKKKEPIPEAPPGDSGTSKIPSAARGISPNATERVKAARDIVAGNVVAAEAVTPNHRSRAPRAITKYPG
jgi:hypothetical protein